MSDGAMDAAGATGAAGAPPAQASTALPAPERLQAPPAWSAVDFISDLHLSAAMPRTFAAFADHLAATDAHAVMILGDLFELWVGDDARHEVFAQRCVAALRECAQRRTLGIMAGNRDFLMGAALLADCGALHLPDPTVLVAWGQRVLLSHGDELCIADAEYQQFRRLVRSADWQQSFLAKPLAARLTVAREVREASETRRRFDGMNNADADTGLATQWLHAARSATLVHGHTHRPGSDAWPGDLTRHVLSDWDLDQGARAEVLRLSAAGFERRPPTST